MYHTELDTSAICSMEELDTVMDTIQSLGTIDCRRRRVLVCYRFHSCSYRIEWLHRMKAIQSTHWIIIETAQGHIGPVERYRHMMFQWIRLPAPTIELIRFHWTYCSARSTPGDDDVGPPPPDLVSFLCTHWNTMPHPPCDWTTMYHESFTISENYYHTTSSSSSKKKTTSTPSPSHALDMSVESLCSLTIYHLNQCRTHWFPRHGVTAAISTIMESTRCRIQCPEQAHVWAMIDHEWIQMCQQASGQRSWMLFLVTLWGLLLSHPPFVIRS